MSTADQMWSIFAGLGVLFGTLAGLSAYLILYGEYRRHFAGDTKVPRPMALRGALFTFGFFLLLSLAAGYVLPRALR
jgi:hypothetical protein